MAVYLPVRIIINANMLAFLEARADTLRGRWLCTRELDDASLIACHFTRHAKITDKILNEGLSRKQRRENGRGMEHLPCGAIIAPAQVVLYL